MSEKHCPCSWRNRGTESTQTLIGVINDEGEIPDVRVAATIALRNIGSPEAVNVLKRLMKTRT